MSGLYGYIHGRLGDKFKYCVQVFSPDKGAEIYFSYQEMALVGKVPHVSKDDWILVSLSGMVETPRLEAKENFV